MDKLSKSTKIMIWIVMIIGIITIGISILGLINANNNDTSNDVAIEQPF
jgi:hypothetical protein